MMNEPMKQLDLGQAEVFLDKAVGEKGADFVYEWLPTPHSYNNGMGCLYFNEGHPSCIVGHVLSYMGYDFEADVIEGQDVDVVFDELGIKADTDTIELLTTAQQKQDGGVPWGEAVKIAKGLLP